MADEGVRRWDGFLVSGLAAAVLCGLGAVLSFGGVELTRLGGSWYYLLAGIGLLLSGALMFASRGLAAVVFGAVLLVTLGWALWEGGFAFWLLLPRVLGPVVIGAGVLLVLVGKGSWRRWGRAITGFGVAAGLAIMAVSLVVQMRAGEGGKLVETVAPTASQSASDWRHYGRDAGGGRYVPVAAVTNANVGQLKEVWRFRTGDAPEGRLEDQNTPLQVGDALYLCTPRNRVIALDADTGLERWRYDPGLNGDEFHRCRGLAYHEAAQPDGLCARRILATSLAAELIALDAATGRLCTEFGAGGKVDLTEGMGEDARGRYFQTAAPVTAGGLVVVGGWTPDNHRIAEPAGVVRAFDTKTGALVWAWNPMDGGAKTPPAGPYRRGGPNVWSTPVVDEALGLIYLPTGNPTPDHWGSHRSETADAYGSSVVALEMATGRERWKFTTVHHDIWDYDLGSPPMLIDLPDGKGGALAALIQPTKTGQIFVLDRRTGAPLSRVEERPVPQTVAAGEWVSPTQPFSADMPALTDDRLTERMMWGVTPIDQLECRIAFRRHRYEGPFTPPLTEATLQYPGWAGGTNWGGASYDARNNLLILGDVRLPTTVRLVPTDRKELSLERAPDRSPKGANAVPYAAKLDFSMSKLGVPCIAPPHGLLTAIDMASRKIIWRRPVGTAEWTGPLNLKSGLKIPIGTPSMGGSVVTAGGLVFHAATRDPYLRAYDTRTGRTLWQGRLPVAANATPMTYVSPKSGRQFVVISAGGARNAPDRGDYVVAFALPPALDTPGGGPD